VLKASVGVLQRLYCFVKYYVLGAQLFLHPHSVPHRQHSSDYKCFLLDLIAYRTRRTVCLNPCRNQGAVQSLSRWHKSYYTNCLARNIVPQSVRCYRSLFGCLCRPHYDEQLTRNTQRTVLSVAMHMVRHPRCVFMNYNWIK
jgi:hypothetical protein